MENAPCVDFGEFMAREDYGEDHVNSIIAPILVAVGAGGAPPTRPFPAAGRQGAGV